eukprot:Phypoly_transcript_04339.p1 GENE.Phypoly_transcript_04339~~Phypoly_transcript_04339.p1  ORF type:complete len:714 (+),score=117.94 Phypoly_transcript_04339:77-2143(+)
MASNSAAWRDYINSPEPQATPLPGKWDIKLTPFQRLLVLKCFREEKLIFAFPDFITATLDKDFIELPQFDLARAFTDTSHKTPLIFILSTGADPTSALLRYAAECGMGERLHIISLGQGQGPIAAELISRASKSGDWVLLQNCHLAASWMPSLEKIVSALASDTEVDGTPSEVNKDFRLLLSSMPTEVFPVSILQNGVKLTNEPPKGIRANLMRMFTDMTETMFEGGENSRAWKKLLFGLCFFHATIQERKKFGPLGWNIKYEFNESDLQVSTEILQMLLSDYSTIPWDALRYLTGEISYGGRVTDEWDRRCLKSVLNNFYTQAMLDDTYKISESGTYYAPPEGSLSQYKQYIEQLPYTDKPEVFGLHENANITYQAQETDRFTSTILSIQPRVIDSSSGKGSSAEKVEELAGVILGNLPAPLQQSEGLADLFAMDEHGRMHPLSTFLLQEMFRFNRLLGVIKRSLIQLQKAIKGLVVMSVELEKMFNSLMDNQVPVIWANAAYPSRKGLSSWVQDFHQRVAFLRGWLTKGMPACYWISGFFFPQGFLTGVLQHHARKTNTPVDRLSFSFEVVNDDPQSITVAPEEGAYIYGLFMDGARWSKETNAIADSLPGEIASVFPALHVVPREKYTPDPRDYMTPIYKTSVRAGTLSTTGHSTNFIIPAALKTTHPPDYWVLKGVALLCQLDT